MKAAVRNYALVTAAYWAFTLSGALYPRAGLPGCLWGALGFALATTGISVGLPRGGGKALDAHVVVEGGD